MYFNLFDSHEMTNLVSIITAVHLAALSQIESGDNDYAVGPQGEVSRYQIEPKIWRKLLIAKGAHGLPHDRWLAEDLALFLWQSREIEFKNLHKREPNLRELYLLWHRPALMIGHKRSPTKRELERAIGFENLFKSLWPPANSASEVTEKLTGQAASVADAA